MNQPFQAPADSASSGKETAGVIKQRVIKTCADRNTLSPHKLMVLLPFGSRKDSLNPLTVKFCCWADKSVAASFVTSSKAALLSHLRCELTLSFRC